MLPSSARARAASRGGLESAAGHGRRCRGRARSRSRPSSGSRSVLGPDAGATHGTARGARRRAAGWDPTQSVPVQTRRREDRELIAAFARITEVHQSPTDTLGRVAWCSRTTTASRSPVASCSNGRARDPGEPGAAHGRLRSPCACPLDSGRTVALAAARVRGRSRGRTRNAMCTSAAATSEAAPGARHAHRAVHPRLRATSAYFTVRLGRTRQFLSRRLLSPSRTTQNGVPRSPTTSVRIGGRRWRRRSARPRRRGVLHDVGLAHLVGGVAPGRVRSERREHDDAARADRHVDRLSPVAPTLEADRRSRCASVPSRCAPGITDTHPFSSVASVIAIQHVRYACGSTNV